MRSASTQPCPSNRRKHALGAGWTSVFLELQTASEVGDLAGSHRRSLWLQLKSPQTALGPCTALLLGDREAFLCGVPLPISSGGRDSAWYLTGAGFWRRTTSLNHDRELNHMRRHHRSADRWKSTMFPDFFEDSCGRSGRATRSSHAAIRTELLIRAEEPKIACHPMPGKATTPRFFLDTGSQSWNARRS